MRLLRQYPSAIFLLMLWAASIAFQAVFLRPNGNFKKILQARSYNETASCHTRSFLNPLLMFRRSLFCGFSGISCDLIPLFHTSNFPFFLFLSFHYSGSSSSILPLFQFSILPFSFYPLFHYSGSSSSTFHHSNVPVLLFVDSQFLHQFIECWPGDSQFFCCLG